MREVNGIPKDVYVSFVAVWKEAQSLWKAGRSREVRSECPRGPRRWLEVGLPELSEELFCLACGVCSDAANVGVLPRPELAAAFSHGA